MSVRATPLSEVAIPDRKGVASGRCGHGDPDVQTITDSSGAEQMLLEFRGGQQNSSSTS
jgi:hypothetical protein